MLILYTIFNFIEGGSYFRYIDDDENMEYIIQDRCNGDVLTQIAYVTVIVSLGLLALAVLKYANDSQGASKIFKETRCIFFGTNIGAIVVVVFGVFITFTSSHELQILSRGLGMIIYVILCIYIQKYIIFRCIIRYYCEHIFFI